MEDLARLESQFLGAYDNYADAIFRHCWFRVRERELAKDLMQEAFIKTWKYMIEGKKIKEIRPFLYKVADNLIVDWSRKRRSWSLDDLKEKGFEPQAEENFAAVAEAREMAQCLNFLEPSYREVMVMRYIDDLSPKEIAGILGDSENNVSVRIHRATKKLREKLEPYEV